MIFLVERYGVYQQGVVGIFDTKIQATAAKKLAKSKEFDDYHKFVITEIKLNEVYSCIDPDRRLPSGKVQ